MPKDYCPLCGTECDFFKSSVHKKAVFECPSCKMLWAWERISIEEISKVAKAN